MPAELAERRRGLAATQAGPPLEARPGSSGPLQAGAAVPSRPATCSHTGHAPQQHLSWPWYAAQAWQSPVARTASANAGPPPPAGAGPPAGRRPSSTLPPLPAHLRASVKGYQPPDVPAAGTPAAPAAAGWEAAWPAEAGTAEGGNGAVDGVPGAAVDAWFAEADWDGDGRLAGTEAKAFFARTGLPQESLIRVGLPGL